MKLLKMPYRIPTQNIISTKQSNAIVVAVVVVLVE